MRGTAALTAAVPFSSIVSPLLQGEENADNPVAVLLIDTDRATKPISQGIYGQFLEHINHSVEDGLFAEQIRGAGFEGKDFETYWTAGATRGEVTLVDSSFKNGSKSVRLSVHGGRASIQQGRIFLERGVAYDGFLWVKQEQGSPHLSLQVRAANGDPIAAVPLPAARGEWHRVAFDFSSSLRDTQATIEIAAFGRGALLLDFVSLARSDVRQNGMFRPDLLEALRKLRPAFIRWPGGSFASTYKWKEGIGPYEARGYHPNVFWGGYSDYYGFGTDEFLDLCQKLGAEPLITLAAQGTSQEQIEYALDWVHYLNDPPSTEWGKRRAANGHVEPYNVRLFQIDNEPMNNGFTPQSYAEIVNAFGPRLRAAAPHAKIIACGQKRSNDMDWSETIIDLAGANFDVLGCHNYEYEPVNFETGIRRIQNYLEKLRDYVRTSKHPNIEIGVLEWSLQHTYDWRAGLHAAGSLMMYEELSPNLTMTCPALLMRNTTDDPTWTSAIYHDHVSWFPGGSFPVSKLFREHYAEHFLASATGTFHRVRDTKLLLDKVSTAIPQGWQPGSVDSVATASADGKRIVVKAVNYEGRQNTLLIRLQGAKSPERAAVTLHTISAGLMDAASLEYPDRIKAESRQLEYAKDLSIRLEPYTVAVLEIRSL
ncbi:carbohydrate binding domain-containing protein [Terriglobus albidus]|uniref:carbohydrate binding domain-containing protein n=1 Tax=Terriglobus albidus TaxID=1592106 RepID=UPI0021E0DB8A|nr:carbohydrate binding domain-containing protein [Terriglobus albidus]